MASASRPTRWIGTGAPSLTSRAMRRTSRTESVGNNPLFVVDTTAPHSFSPGDGVPLNFETGDSILGLAQSPSADTSRTFQSAVSEDIDIRVAGDGATLSVVSGSEWGGSANLGSDDRVMLVGNGADSRDLSAQMTIAEAVAQQSSAGVRCGIIARYFLGAFDTVRWRRRPYRRHFIYEPACPPHLAGSDVT